ncbi:hypothetical protein L2E82_33018 [Cichorium intybus]|uniref:Uncharacterized protein n=1 Tax=Cichorium intybus TaxID=13427 RepID=A0ACB9BHX6_CICIN|nr:hypothetical protein L2E82_33018 [Cichorium intybus]
MEPLFLNASFGYLLDLDATLCKQISCILWFNKIEEIISKMKSYLERSEISLLEELETNDKHSSHTLN